MIVTCPACNARYKINGDKLPGRGAKITCPRCQHLFVVYKSDSETGISVTEVDTLDFRDVGLQWTARKGLGVTYDFFTLATLKTYLESGRLDQWDAISYDRRTWQVLKTIDDIDAFFQDIFDKASRGELQIAAEEEDEEEDAEDAPTTLLGSGSSMSEELMRAIEDVATAPPARRRTDEPVLVGGEDTQPFQVSAPTKTPAPVSRANRAPPQQETVSNGAKIVIIMLLLCILLMCLYIYFSKQAVTISADIESTSTSKVEHADPV